jgi:hypothetical protein
MKSLSAYSISKALHKSAVAQALIAIETYNATTLDRTSNHYARILADWLDITPTASSGRMSQVQTLHHMLCFPIDLWN